MCVFKILSLAFQDAHFIPLNCGVPPYGQVCGSFFFSFFCLDVLVFVDTQLPSDWTAVRMINDCQVATTGTGVGMMLPSF